MHDGESDHTLNKSLGSDSGEVLSARRGEEIKEMCEMPGAGSSRSKLKSRNSLEGVMCAVAGKEGLGYSTGPSNFFESLPLAEGSH